MGKTKKTAALKQGIDAYRKTLRHRDAEETPENAAGVSGGTPDGADRDDARGGTPGGTRGGTPKPPAGQSGNRPPAPGRRRLTPGWTALKTTDVPSGDSKLRRVAKFLVLVGAEEAARILSELDLEMVEALSREIAGIRGVGGDEAAAILAEFEELFSTAYGWTGTAKGGVEIARKHLYVAFGKEKGEAYLRSAIPGGGDNPFDFLESFSGGQIALLLRTEALTTGTLVVSRLPSKLAAETLKNMFPDQKAGIIKRLAHLERTGPEVLERVAAGLREKARRFADAGGEVEHEVDGMGALTAILKQADVSFGENLLASLRGEDPDLSREIQDRLYTLDDMINADDRPLQDKLRAMGDRDIALLLKGRSGAFTEKILSNVSEPRRAAIDEETAWLGPVHRRDADAEGRKFLDWFRKARERGEIMLYTDEDVIR